MPDVPSDTPLMRQYNSLKAEYPDHILFFRLGDFYEMFGQDALLASKILNITLTTRDKKKEGAIPLCGIPYHSLQAYIKRILDRGLKVAICEQMEDPKLAKGIVRRDVVRLITPGTVLESDLLNEKENSFLAALFPAPYGIGISFIDLTTGDFRTTEYKGADFFQKMQDEINRLEPKEIVLPQSLKGEASLKECLNEDFMHITYAENGISSEKEAFNVLKDFYSIEQGEGLGLEGHTLAICASAILCSYLRKTQKRPLTHIRAPLFYGLGDYMILDQSTITNLELVRSIDSRSREGTLLGVLDLTSTPMGARTFRDWILHPLLNIEHIQMRLDAVEELLHSQHIRSAIRDLLKGVYDLERISSRIALGLATPQNLLALKASIPYIQKIRMQASSLTSSLLLNVAKRYHPLDEIYKIIDSTITDDPPSTTQKIGLIKRNVDKELDHLYDITLNGKQWIARLEADERKRTGISSLKVRFNKVFGYYIEITKANLSSIPDEYIRKQTLINGERFVTEELKQFESEVLGAEERILQLEKNIYSSLLEELSIHIPSIQETSRALAHIDCLISMADVAAQRNYSKPLVDKSFEIDIEQGRHPVLESCQKERPFVANDTFIGCESQQLIILTGPNMAGKSTYMRQVALIVLMVQIGSFVPAKKTRIGLVDRIFTRVGASDRLYKGQSTFMVEMIETASILHQATKRSLIIMDEIGRGTSTYDGISIAWAVAEYLHDQKGGGARTLFATHYHELTELPVSLLKARNYSMSVHEEKGNVIFLYQVREGGSDRSYGVHVAKLAGLPREVIEKACHILENMEDQKGTDILHQKSDSKREKFIKPLQLSLFSDPKQDLIQELKDIDPTRLSPLKALKMINKWKQQVD